MAVVAVVCCNLLLGYTLIKSNATDEIAKVFTLSGDSEEMHTQWDNAYNEIKNNPNNTYKIVLDNDWQPSHELSAREGGNIIFDLNGYTVDGSNWVEGTAFIRGAATSQVAANAFVKIVDTSLTQNGVFTGFSVPLINSIKVEIAGGTFTKNYDSITTGLADVIMSGGLITQNDSIHYVLCTGGSITITGGEIIDNITSWELIRQGSSSKPLTITGGKIANNKANDNYSIIYASSKCEISGGEIYGNTAVDDKIIDFLLTAYGSAGTGIVNITGGTVINSVGTGMSINTGSLIVSGGNIFNGTVQNLSLANNVNEYKVGDKADLTVTARFSGSYNGQTKTADIILSPAEYSITYPNGDSLKKGSNAVTITYDGVSKEISLTAICEHNYGDWVVEKEPEIGNPGVRHRSCLICGETEREDITLDLTGLKVTDNKKSYADGDEADLTIEAVYTRSDNNTEVPYKLTNDDYEITYSDGNALVAGDNTVTITYQGKTTEITIEVAAEPEQPDDGNDDNNNGETGDNQTPTTPDDTEQPTPEAPKAETPDNNNTPWIMLFVGIGVGAVLLVGGITLGVVLSKRKK